MNCPKCGFQYNDGRECPRCGIVYSRYRVELPPATIVATPPPKRTKKPPRRFWFYFRIARWAVLAFVIAAVLFVLHASDPPRIILPPDVSQRAEDKIHKFESEIQRGVNDKLELDQSELNGWLIDNIALKKPGASQIDNASSKEAQSSIRDLKIELLENDLHMYVVFETYGIVLSMELKGRPFIRDGYVEFEPTAGKLGSFPLVTESLRRKAVDSLFNSPENKETFKLPPEVQDIGVNHGNLVITSNPKNSIS